MNVISEANVQQREYDIISAASLAEGNTHVLKDGDAFALFDPHGDIRPVGNGEQGFYFEDTRHLSQMELRLEGRRPVLLSSTVSQDNTLLTVDLSNADFEDAEGRAVHHGMLHLFRAKLLFEGACYEHVRVRNYGSEPVSCEMAFLLDADYADIFEVRGTSRAKRGRRSPTTTERDGVVLGYQGLDEVRRTTRVSCQPAPETVSESYISYQVSLAPHEHADFYIRIAAHKDVDADGLPEKSQGEQVDYEEAKQQRRERVRSVEGASCRVHTSNEQFNAWVSRSLEDVNLLLTEVPQGHYPYAGIPWYNTFFGRDGLLTALMMLWVNPDIARGVLLYLASTQADREDPSRDAQPGKILHEARKCEMAATGEVPFDQYYGTIDATPLFVLLAGHYCRHTGDYAFAERLWPNVEHALQWIDEYGDRDGDGFVEYAAEAEGALTQQGWKDSEDSVMHADGRLAEPPIALCEVQAYVFAARRAAAEMAEMLGRTERADALRRQADELQQRFEERFWCEDLGLYALALDGEKRPCRVRSSNAGQVLFSGIAPPDRARRVAASLFADDCFSEWGIRTLSEEERRYNPMSYHNGSVWPHDNALIGLGLGQYGLKEHVHRLLKNFFDASSFDELQRLSELYCGFVRRPGEGPTPYPVACAPQAWASAVVFCLLQACLGLHVDAAGQRVVLREPTLPHFLKEVQLRNLRVGSHSVDLAFQRYEQNVGVEVLRRDAEVEVVTIA